MKIIYQTALYCFLSTFIMTGPAVSAVKTGDTAPDFLLEGTNGKSHRLSDFKGKYVILEWVNHDCPFVKKHYNSQNMQNLQKAYSDQGVVWLSINSSAHGNQGHYHPDEANRLTEKKGASPTAVLMDFEGEVGKMYDAQTTPHMYIIDPAGNIIYQGAIDSIASTDIDDIGTAKNYVKQAMDEVMAGQPVSIPVTKSYGCSVKY